MTYAIFVSGGQQFRAEPGKTVQVPKLDVEPGAKVTFERVLLTSDGQKVQTGAPVVKGEKVTGEVVKHGKGDKIRIFRIARRAGYRLHVGQRRQCTEVEIGEVTLG